MRSASLAFITIGVIILLTSGSRAAEFGIASTNDGAVAVTLTGEITEGDSDSLRKIVQTTKNNSRKIAAVRLNSPGGNLVESVKLAEIIQFGNLATSVIASSKCASACFVVFAAGTSKYAAYASSIGVHGASDEEGRETIQSGAATVVMARIVKELGVPASIIGKMVVTPPDEMVWLTPFCLCLGCALIHS